MAGLELGMVFTSKLELEGVRNSYSYVGRFHLSLPTNLAFCIFVAG